MITEFAKAAPFELFKNEEVVDFMSLFFFQSTMIFLVLLPQFLIILAYCLNAIYHFQI